MDNTNTSHSRIAKNTVFLYLRMLLLMAVSFYTTRVVLNALGDVDYGVYNVVGGIVGFMSFINSSMALASNRFLAFAIGKNDNTLLSQTFSMALILHFLIATIILLIGETAGIWYFYHYLNIPADKYKAAMWVYQLSLAGAFITITVVPMTSLIVAYERMKAFAWVSLLEGFLKLGVAFLLVALMVNKLILYAWLMFGVTVITTSIWRIYCITKFHNVKFQLKWNKHLFKEMYSFVGWQFLGSFSWILRAQGVALVLNFFFGPILNTARTISVQVNSGVTSLVQNFQMAVNPQLVKSYAQDDLTGMHDLIIKSSKFSFFLLYIFALPVIMQAEPILSLWLKNIPEYAVIFVKLALLSVLVDSFATGTMTHAVLASGKIKQYQPITAGILFLDIFLVYFVYKIGAPPQAMYYVEIILYFTVFLIRLLLLRKIIRLSIRRYIRYTTIPIVATCVISLPIAYIISIQFKNGDFWSILISSFIVFLIVATCVFTVGMKANERKYILNIVKLRIL